MFLILANGVQISGRHTDPDEAKAALDALTAANPGAEFTVFQQVHPKDPDAEPQSAVVDGETKVPTGEATELTPATSAKTPEVAQGQADAHHGE